MLLCQVVVFSST